MPMMARKVVVLPAPLRPSKVTTSPSPTANAMPCRTCDSPYQACRFSTRRSSSAENNSGMAGPHIGLDHLGVVGHCRVVSLGEDAPAGQHGDGLRQVGDDGQVVLDHQHRAVARRLADQPGNTPDILVAET